MEESYQVPKICFYSWRYRALFSHISAILPITLGKSPGAIVASRDRTISIVNVDTQEKLKVVPIFEPIEDAVLLTNGQLLTVGEEGSLKFWEYLTGKLVLKKQLIR